MKKAINLNDNTVYLISDAGSVLGTKKHSRIPRKLKKILKKENPEGLDLLTDVSGIPLSSFYND
jgi:hypothetical protein